MWGNQGGYENAGGFYDQSDNQAGTPGGGTAEKKRNRAQNLVPVRISDILSAPEEGPTIEGRPVGIVEIVGTVQSVDQQATKTIYVIDDGTGSINAVHWTDTDGHPKQSASSGDAISERMSARIVGNVRSNKGDKHIMVFRICAVEGQAEIDAHKLEIVHATLLIRQLADKENRSIGLSNSMVAPAATSAAFGNPKQDAVFKILSGCTREEGLSRDEMMNELGGRMTKKELDEALEYLSGEGHIYSTMDEDHFKTTDG